TRLYVDGDHVGVLAGNFELAGEAKVMGARIEANTDPMGDGSVMHKWATYDNALTDEQIAGLANEAAPLPDLVDISAAGDAVVPTSDNHPAGEHAGLAIDDNDQTKYLNFDGANNNASGLTITTAGGVVTGLGLTSANDAPDRDPATFVLSGSNDGGATLTEIASGDVPAFGARFERQEVRFANDAAYTTYELIFPTTAGSSTCCMQIAEIELLGTPADVPETPAPAELPWSVGLNDDGWPAGDGGGANTTFVQEAGVNELPGNPANAEVAQQGDDDYYWAGDYSTVIAGNGDYTPVGLVEVNEESAERAFAGLDNDLRYHFNLPESLEPTDRLTVSYDALNLHGDQADSRYGIEVYVNNVLVQPETVIRPDQLGQTYDTAPFTLADVNAEVGSGYDNILTLKGVNYNAEGGGNWMGIDYVQLSQAGPAPDLASGLVAHWPLDEIAGETTPDVVSGYDMDLTNISGDNVVAGKVGNAISFSNADQTLLSRKHGADDDLPANKHDSFTVSFWSKVNGTGQNDLRLFSESNTQGNNSPLFNIGTRNNGSDGTVDLYIRSIGGGPTVGHIFSTAEPFDDEWHHVVFVQDNLARSIYVDGVLDDLQIG
ncbi:MAG: LamG-like jellyroll fold domain-containing protein, partial [Verrucomicrobiia bacterium]